jgi:hypothetical protein
VSVINLVFIFAKNAKIGNFDPKCFSLCVKNNHISLNWKIAWVFSIRYHNICRTLVALGLTH